MISTGWARKPLRCVLAAVLTAIGWTAGAQDGPPALIPPALTPPASSPAADHPRPVTRPRERNNGLLLIPGVTAPAPKRASTPPRPAIAPAARPSPPLNPVPAVRTPAVRPAPGVLTLEPITEDLDDEPPARELVPPARSAPRTARPSLSNPEGPETVQSPARAARLAPARGSNGIFGRFFSPPVTGEEVDEPSSSKTVEPPSDPAMDAALKRRIEKQVHQSLGDQVRSIEVRVNGRDVLLRAQASRFWFRRRVRRGLETLPLPSGYRSKVEMLD